MKYYIELDSGTPNARVHETTAPHMWPDAKRLSAKVGKARLKAYAIKYLQAALKPGDTVYCILRNVSRSGMSRQIDFLINGADCRPRTISRLIADALEYPQADGGALKVSGCGMDMGFSVVSKLSIALYCPDKYTHEGAYALNPSWL